MAASDPQEAADRQMCQGDALALKIDDEIILCLRMDADAPLMKQAHKILDATLARLCPGVNRKELVEEDLTDQVVPFIRRLGLWQNESFAFKVSTGSTPLGRGACGFGPNQHHRRRVASLALAAKFICKTPHESQDVQFLFGTHFGLQHLTRQCNRQLVAPLAAPDPTCPSWSSNRSAEVTPRNGKELLQHMARSLGAAEEVLEDPYLSVQESSRRVVCAACDKSLTFAHVKSKKHQLYLENIAGTLRWLHCKRPDRVYLKLLEPSPQPNHSATTNHTTDTAGSVLSGRSSAPGAPADPTISSTAMHSTAPFASPLAAEPRPTASTSAPTVVEKLQYTSDLYATAEQTGLEEPSSSKRYTKCPADLPSAEEICNFLMRMSGIKDLRLPREYPPRADVESQALEKDMSVPPADQEIEEENAVVHSHRRHGRPGRGFVPERLNGEALEGSTECSDPKFALDCLD